MLGHGSEGVMPKEDFWGRGVMKGKGAWKGGEVGRDGVEWERRKVVSRERGKLKKKWRNGREGRKYGRRKGM